MLALHAYVVFIKSIPLNQPSDAFICNFVCNGFTQVVKDCDNKDEMRCYIKGLMIVLDYLLPQKAALMQKALLELLPILLKQKEVGFEQECSEFVNYLTSYMEEHMRESEDVVDFLGSMSSGRADDLRCPNLTVFKEKLKTHKISLKRPRYVFSDTLRRYITSVFIIKIICDNFNCPTLTVHDIQPGDRETDRQRSSFLGQKSSI